MKVFTGAHFIVFRRRERTLPLFDDRARTKKKTLDKIFFTWWAERGRAGSLINNYIKLYTFIGRHDGWRAMCIWN